MEAKGVIVQEHKKNFVQKFEQRGDNSCRFGVTESESEGANFQSHQGVEKIEFISFCLVSFYFVSFCPFSISSRITLR